MRTHQILSLTVLAAVSLAGCIDFPGEGEFCAQPGAPCDAGITDAGVTDAGVTDAGVTDAGVTDAGVTDAGATDAGRFTVVIRRRTGLGADGGVTVFEDLTPRLCDPSCSLTAGAMVSVVADPTSGLAQLFGPCPTSVSVSVSGSCDFPLTRDETVTVAFWRHNYAFVTSDTFVAGQLGGTDGGDLRCRDIARDTSVPGTFIALLTQRGTSGERRLRDAGARGFVGTTELPFADDTASLFRYTSTTIRYPLDHENGSPANGERMMTGVTPDMSPGENCVEWTQPGASFDFGLSGGATTTWLQQPGLAFNQLPRCDTAAHLYCFGTDSAAVLPAQPPLPDGGRRLFLSSDTFRSGGGYDAGVILCVSEATDAGFGPRFLPLLSTTDRSVSSRFDGGLDRPVYRVDGVRLASTTAVFFDAGLLEAAPTASAGVSFPQNPLIALGGRALSSPGFAIDNCADWTHADAGSQMAIGDARFRWAALDGGFGREPCAAPMTLLCLEE